MNSILKFLFKPAPGPASIVLIRLAVGLIFFTQGILKYPILIWAWFASRELDSRIRISRHTSWNV